jgi:hypothetical protein
MFGGQNEVSHTDALLPPVSLLYRRRIEAIPYREIKLLQQLDHPDGTLEKD